MTWKTHPPFEVVFPQWKAFFPKLWIFCQSFSIKLSFVSVQLEHLPQVRTKCTDLLGLSVKYHLNRFKGQVHALASSFWKYFLDHYWPVMLDIEQPMMCPFFSGICSDGCYSLQTYQVNTSINHRWSPERHGLQVRWHWGVPIMVLCSFFSSSADHDGSLFVFFIWKIIKNWHQAQGPHLLHSDFSLSQKKRTVKTRQKMFAEIFRESDFPQAERIW